METQSDRNLISSNPTPSLLVGILLIAAGILFLVARIANFDLGQYGWPLFVIVPGFALIALGLTNRSAAGLVIPGSIVAVTGLMLAVQNAFDLWATWSYTWALIIPGAIGLGTLILGIIRGDRRQINGGVQAVVAGLSLFAIFGIFFDGILHVSGFNFGTVGDIVLPVVLIAIGLLLLILRIAAGLGKSRTNGPVGSETAAIG